MTRTRWIGLIVVALVVDAIAVRLGAVDPVAKLAGTAAWTTARAAGVTAFGALTLDVVFGLFVSTGAIDRVIPRAASVDIHRWLSRVALGFVAVHVLALLADGWIDFDALDVLIPGVSTYRPGAVALGVLAMHAAVVVHASFGWRERIGVRAWRALHGTAFAVFAAAVAHGLLAGSDTSRLRVFYAGSCAIVCGLVIVRIGRGMMRAWRTSSRSRPTTASVPRLSSATPPPRTS